MASYVYLATDESKKYVKIGVTDDIKRRQKEIRNMNPTFKMFYAWRPSQVTAYEAERYFHTYFAEKRVSGEWFNLSIDDIMIMTSGKGKYKLMSILGRKS
jgi:predicted GIY-YIG superfamily endonuclease